MGLGFNTDLAGDEIGQQRVTQGSEGAGHEKASSDALECWTGNLLERFNKVWRRNNNRNACKGVPGYCVENGAVRVLLQARHDLSGGKVGVAAVYIVLAAKSVAGLVHCHGNAHKCNPAHGPASRNDGCAYWEYLCR